MRKQSSRDFKLTNKQILPLAPQPLPALVTKQTCKEKTKKNLKTIIYISRDS